MKTTFQIWYQKPGQWDHRFRTEPDPNDLEATHIFLKHMEIDGGSLTSDPFHEAQLEKVFHDMQGEVWSPNGEARSLIIEKGLAHTSMSVGDIVVVGRERGPVYMVDIFGFRFLK